MILGQSTKVSDPKQPHSISNPLIMTDVIAIRNAIIINEIIKAADRYQKPNSNKDPQISSIQGRIIATRLTSKSGKS